ncbi:dynein heavy chain axonemal [Stylonychia lemnae]|uniref:Dynein heavy chain axonemal n=1 Tax=Stylonychia lemnae TaxID=5949 RepID=A0A078A7A0_STYLE|nr:dynein heavy chain axonemal [Stylonychia lemnae]|eukprot:CDW77756.1 dynein heavy chain axonemal [Stylonychia lemnae]
MESKYKKQHASSQEKQELRPARITLNDGLNQSLSMVPNTTDSKVRTDIIQLTEKTAILEQILGRKNQSHNSKVNLSFAGGASGGADEDQSKYYKQSTLRMEADLSRTKDGFISSGGQVSSHMEKISLVPKFGDLQITMTKRLGSKGKQDQDSRNASSLSHHNRQQLTLETPSGHQRGDSMVEHHMTFDYQNTSQQSRLLAEEDVKLPQTIKNIKLNNKFSKDRGGDGILSNIRMKSQTTRNNWHANNLSVDQSSQTQDYSENPTQRFTMPFKDLKQDKINTQISQNRQIDQNYRELSVSLNKFLKDKQNYNSVTNREQKESNRTVKNTYQFDKRQRSLTHDKEESSYIASHEVRPKSLIKIPKDIILYQISKKIGNRAQNLDEIVSVSQNQSNQRAVKSGAHQQSYLDYLEKGMLEQSTDQKDSRNTNAASQQQTTTARVTHYRSFMGSNNTRNITNLNASNIESKSILDQSTIQQNQDNQSQSFHITDLLEKTLKDDRNPNKSKQIIEYYKRSVKLNGDLDKNKEIMIKNYRLHVVTDDQDLSEKDRKLLGLTTGTSIYVSNSIVKPETFKFSTKIVHQMPGAINFDQITDYDTKRNRSVTKKCKQNLSTIEEDIQLDTFLTEFSQKYNTEDLDEIQRLENKFFSLENNNSMLIINEDLNEKDSLIGDDSYLQQVKDSHQVIMYQWNQPGKVSKLSSIMESKLEHKSQRSSPTKKYQQYGNQSPRIRDINQSMLKQNDQPQLSVYLIPESSIPAIGSQVYFDSLKLSKVNTRVKNEYDQFISQTRSITVTNSQNKKEGLQTLNYFDCKKAFNITSYQLTHLDDPLFKTDTFPPELFVNFQKWVEPLILRLRQWQSLQPDEAETFKIMADTQYFSTNGEAQSIEVQLIEFDPASSKFLVENKKLGIRTWRSRLFMKLKDDNAELIQKQREKIKRIMLETKEFLRLHRLILYELCPKYTYIQMAPQFRERIKYFLKIDAEKVNKESYEKLIIQAEALFVFAIFKSVLISQIMDPNIKKIVIDNRIRLNSGAIFQYIPQLKEKIDLQGLKQYSMRDRKIELDQNSMLLMDKKYIQLPIFLNKVTAETISKYKLFSFPFDILLLTSQGSDVFKKSDLQNLDQKVNEFPVQHKYFIQAQKIVTDYFHSMARFRWAEAIYQEVWNFVKDDFEYVTGKQILEEQVDPVLRRLFYQLKLYMQTILFDHYELALQEYLEFLMSFLMRDPESSHSLVSQSISKSRFIKLSSSRNIKDKNSSIKNDLQLIPMKRKPFVYIQAIIENKAANKYYTKMESGTKPDLEKVKNDLQSVVTSMHEALKGIERVDKLVFPLLVLEFPSLNPPDINKNEKLKIYIRSIEAVIDEGLRQSYEKMSDIDRYMFIYDKKIDEVILELKKKTFILLNEMENENNSMSKNSSLESISQLSSQSEEQLVMVNNHQSAMNQTQTQAVNAPNINLSMGPEVAFRSIDIDDGLFKEELESYKLVFWEIREEINNQYDFGLVYLDCLPFKERILKHIKSLIDHLENYAKKEFLNKLNSIQNEINSVKSKLEEKVQSIDDVILLLDYIEVIKRPDNKVDELSIKIDELKLRMIFILNIKINLKSDDYMLYLNMLNWPRTFKAWLDDRKIELQRAKDNLFYEMGNEKDMIFEKIEEFKKQIYMIKKEGLIRESEIENQSQQYTQEEFFSPTFRKRRQLAKQNNINFQSIDMMNATVLSGSLQVPNQSSDNFRLQKDSTIATFKFIAKEIKWDDYRFEPEVIDEVFDMTDQLKNEYDSIERLTAQINKRETLLGVAQTEFKELRIILDDLKPLYDLWQIASKFSKTFPKGNVTDWINELKRLSKNNFLKSAVKQMELLSFIYQALLQFKIYLPMLKAMRTKGLVLRHWRMIGNKLDFVVDPSTVTLRKLINLKLYEEDKLHVIKSICEIATKEYAVMTSLDSLDRELKALEFTLQVLKENPVQQPLTVIQVQNQTYTSNMSQIQPPTENPLIVLKLGELISLFEEYFMRVSVLKTNPFVKNFYDKMIELEKIVKHVVEILNEWQLFQKNWIYLESIFSLEEIQKYLDKESKKFQGIDAFYRSVTKSFEQTPQVYKACQREAFLIQLQRFNNECEGIISGLNQFLESKREKFPRLYFLSNEEMIEIFGKARDTRKSTNLKVQSPAFLIKLFDGIDLVTINRDGEISEIISKENEVVKLIKKVNSFDCTPEKWLFDLERGMKNSMKLNLYLAYNTFEKQKLEEWLSHWPGQCILTASQIWFGQEIFNMFTASLEIKKYEVGQDYTNPVLTSAINSPRLENTNSSYSRAALDSPKLSFKQSPKELNIQKLQRQSVFLDEVLDKKLMKQVEKVIELQEKTQLKLTVPFLQQMDDFAYKLREYISDFAEMIKVKQSKITRITTINLIAVFIYFREILDNLIEQKISKVDDFQWQMILKFSFKDIASNLVIDYENPNNGQEERMKVDTQKLEIACEVFNSQRLYGFEYIGNSSRLIVTPLTERCQRSLLIALHYFYGGAPEGPVGTGKTETTKDLAKQVAKLCFVLNCSSNFDYTSVVRFFKGVASSGSWVCFDEFNRMDPHILSIISQVIIAIQGAIKKQSPTLFIDETKVQIRPECAIFITLNPYYAGRTELPLNLKNLFRPISMVIPDSTIIAENLLFAAGFQSARILAKNIVNIQSLTERMIHQEEFQNDFGLRSIKAIVSIAEKMKLLSYDLIETDLAYIIDDKQIAKLPTKSQEVIKEFINKEPDEVSSQKARRESELITQQKGSMRKTGIEAIKEELEDDHDDVVMSESFYQSTSQKRQSQRRDGVNRKLLTGNIFEKVHGFGTDIKQIHKELLYKQLGLDPRIKKTTELELENHIIMKAVKDYNESKFSIEDNKIYGQILKDVFQDQFKQENDVSKDNNLKSCIKQTLIEMKYDVSNDIVELVYQLYELQQVKHGIIVVGKTQSGKSTIIKTLESSLNKSSSNELSLMILEKRKERLKEITKDIEELNKAKQPLRKQPTANISRGNVRSQMSMVSGGQSDSTQRRGFGAPSDTRSSRAQNILAEVYKKTKLTQKEIDYLAKDLKIQGVQTQIINPKSMEMNELFGQFEEETHSWNEGIFTKLFREYANEHHNKKKKWIILDGPIDSLWVENLNSILDDNKKMSLANGESIFMSKYMTLMLETDSLLNTTPATVSRCGLIYLQQSKLIKPKMLFNAWLRSIPNVLKEYEIEIEQQASCLLKEALQVFQSNKERSNLIYQVVDQYWLIKTFLRLMESFVHDYRGYDERLEDKTNESNLNHQRELEESNFNAKDRESHDDSNVITNVQSKVALTSQKSEVNITIMNKTQGKQETQHKPNHRNPVNRFLNDEIRSENAIKFTPVWLEAAIIFSVTWAFGSIMNDVGKNELDVAIREKLNDFKYDLQLYQKQKKKQQQQNEQNDKKGGFDTHNQLNNTAMNDSVMIKSVIDEYDGLKQWSDEFDDVSIEQPKFLSEFPIQNGQSIFESYFALDQSNWVKFNVEREVNQAIVNFHSLPDSMKKVQNIYVPTIESIKYQYLLECYIINQTSTLLVGASTTGKTSLIRDSLFHQVFQYTYQFVIDHITLSHSSQSDLVRKTMERKLELAQEKNVRFMKPTGSKKLVLYIDDIHMPSQDAYGYQSANEMIRDYFTLGGWHQSRTKKFNQVKDLTIISVLSTINSCQSVLGMQNNKQTPQVSERLLHHFAVIGIDEIKRNSLKSMFQIITSMLANQWPSEIQQFSSKVLQFVLDLYYSISEQLKPTPLKVHYHFSWRDIFRICNGLMLVESNYLKDQVSLMKLLYHECLRVYADKIAIESDYEWLNSKLKELSLKHFDMNGNLEEQNSRASSQQFIRKNTQKEKSMTSQEDLAFPISNPKDLYFSVYNLDVEGYYVEIENINRVGEAIDKMLEKYNEASDRSQINLILFNDINRILLKMVRVLSTSNGHMLVVTVKGSGITNLQKLASFSLGYQLKQLEMLPGFSLEEWRLEMKKLLLRAGQDDKPVVLSMDQFKVQLDRQYDDVECIINNNISSDIMYPQEIDNCLSYIYQQIEMEKLAKLNKNLNVINSSAMGDQFSSDPDLSQSRRMQVMNDLQASALSAIQKSPQLQCELYNYFLKRIKNNFHLLLTFSPTGEDFKKNLVKYQTFLANCTIIWTFDYNQQALEELGSQFMEFADYKELAQQNGDQIIEKKEIRKQLDKIRGRQDTMQQNSKVLHCCVQMYLNAKEMSKKFFQQSGQILYFTPSSFLGMFSNFRRLHTERKKNVMDIQKRYENGLERIRVTQIAIQEYHIELEQKIPVLQDKQKKLIMEIQEIEGRFNNVKKERDLLKREEFNIQQDCETALQIKIQCEEALNKVAPALNEAVNSIQSLSKHDLSELRAMKKPPKVIKLVLKAVCILLQVQPIRKKAKDGIHFKESFWAAAQSKEVLGNVRLPDMLIEYDRNKISQNMMVSIEEVLVDSDYTYENAYRASKAATGMFKWVKAIREYYYIFQEIEPRRDAFMLSEKQHSIKVEELQLKRKELGSLEIYLIELQEILDEKDQIIEDLKIQIQDCKIKKKRADVLLRGLSSEKQKWIVCTRMLAGKYLTVTGDVLLSSAFISLLSGYTQKYRNKLIKKWKKLLQEQGLPVSESFNFNDLFGDPMKIRDWQMNGLPQDHLSVNNAIIMEKSKNYCICIDPQYQACNWLKNQYYDNGLIITKYGDNYFRKSLEIAIELGKPVLVENIGDKVDLTLHSLLEKDIVKHGSQRLIKFCRKTFKFDKNFDLFLITNLKNPHFDVNISNFATMVNFYVTFDGLQQQLLSLVVANERSDLEEKFSENTKEAFENIRGLKEIENAILEQLQMDVSKLLGDELLIKTLNESRNTAELIAMKLKAINQTSQFMQKSRDVYSPISKRASLLYFVVADLSKINNMYQFSLAWFTNVFKKSIQMTNQLKPENKNAKSKLQNSQMSMKTSIGFTIKGNSIDDRIELLIKTFTQELYRKICSSIYEKDRMLVTYLMVLRVLEYEDYLDKTLYSYLLIGPKNPDYSEEPPTQDLKLNWLNKRNWGDLKALSQIKPFTNNNLIEYIKELPAVWNEYYKKNRFSYDELPNKDRLNLIPLLPPPIDDRFDVLPANDLVQSKFMNSFDKSDTEDDQNRPLTRNVSSVLNDEELWRVSSESDEEEQQVNKFTYKKQNLGGNLDEDDNEFLNQEEEMAQYLLDNNPSIFNQQYDGEGKKLDKVKMTKQESDMRAKKELVLKQLIELCVLKCIRPDKISESIDKFLQVVINPSYTSFSQDIAAQYTNQSSKRDITNGSQRNINTSNNSQQTKHTGKQSNSNSKVSNFIGLLKDAFDESNKSTPIFFLITHFQYLSLGKGLEKRVEEKIIKASQAGEKSRCKSQIQIMAFKCCCPEFPKQHSLNVYQSFFITTKVKSIIADDIYSGIKYIMDRLLGPNDEVFKKSKSNAVLHKNLQFCIIYFHSVLVGRKKYGTLGWNVPYEFDFSDFEISGSQLLQMMRRNVIDDETNLKMMRYLIGEINYSGKIQRSEDRIILNAILDDLFCSELAFMKEAVPQNVNKSHYGLPLLEYNADNSFGDFSEFMRSLPEFDQEEIFGFNDNIQRLNQRNMIFDILKKVNLFNTKIEPFNNPLDAQVKDQSDMVVRDMSQKLLLNLPQLFVQEMINSMYPLKYDIPLSTFIHREVFKYNNLLLVIKNSLINLVNMIDGKIHQTIQLDTLWQEILYGIVPRSWLLASYPTCSTSISDFIKNLNERLEFMRNWIEKGLIKEKESIDFEGFNNSNNGLNSYWFPGFFDQSAFLTALRQKKARLETIELEDVEIRFDVMKYMDPKNHQIDNDDVTFITGFWLEGCQWDLAAQFLVETDSQELYVPFPAIKVTTLRKSPIQRMNASTQKIIDCDFYTCPVFKTTMRLANNTYSVENEALMHIPLRTKEQANKWIKRGVALILNPSYY